MLLFFSDCNSHHLLRSSDVACPHSRAFLTDACASIDIFYSPVTAECHLQFHITVDILNRVLLQLEFISLDIGNCEEELSVYENEHLLETGLIQSLCSRTLLYDQRISADWNTMSIVFDRWARSAPFPRPKSTFSATYRGVQLRKGTRNAGRVVQGFPSQNSKVQSIKLATFYISADEIRICATECEPILLQKDYRKPDSPFT